MRIKSFLKWYCEMLKNYSFLVMCVIGLLSIASFASTIIFHDLPNFNEPQTGFETRGTVNSDKLIAWKNLIDSVSHVGPLNSNPLERKHKENKNTKNQRQKTRKKQTKTRVKRFKMEHRNLYANISEDHHQYRDIGWLCGDPLRDYARIVFKSNRGESLFSHSSIVSMCSLEMNSFRLVEGFSNICETKGPADCCPGWSLGQYIALLHNKNSCFSITVKDVEFTFNLLKNCSSYYHSGELLPNCLNFQHRSCNHLPQECTVYNAVYNIFHFLVEKSFLTSTFENLTLAISFLPLARSSAILPYYKTIGNNPLENKEVEIVALEFGLKEALFDEILHKDAFYVIAGILLIFFCIWITIQSFFLTCCAISSIFFAMSLSYFIYVFVLQIKFFPFLNLLAIVIALGVGADDTFILVHYWLSYSNDDDLQRLQKTLKHSFLSMFVTSATTSTAFLTSYISSVTAIKCFSVYASLNILVNFILMLTWMPAALMLSSHLPKWLSIKIQLASSLEKSIRIFFINFVDKVLTEFIIKSSLFWCLLLGVNGMLFTSIVFYFPGLQLPETNEFQLFKSSHPFERYNMKFKNQFNFEAELQNDIRMPLQFIWGILPHDDGNYLQPEYLGSLQFDTSFDMTTYASQRWLLSFCAQLRQQSFYTGSQGAHLSNCFLETFKSWMERRCSDDLSGQIHFPCCRSSKFPFKKDIFHKCLPLAIKDLYSTPRDFWSPGVSGPKFNISSLDVEAFIIEYDSNVPFSYSYSTVKTFRQNVESWMTEILKSAPPEMKSGFFLSSLDFYDVQNSLLTDTMLSVVIALVLSILIVFFSTCSLSLSLLVALSIGCIITVSIGILILLGWKLGILESIALNLSIGLSIDFTLHYGMTYCQHQDSLEKNKVLYTIKSMCSSVTMGALTTLFSGLVLLPSRILAYIQIGTFIVVVMTVSWIYSTFFFSSLLLLTSPKMTSSCSLLKNKIHQTHNKKTPPAIVTIGSFTQRKSSTITQRLNSLISSTVASETRHHNQVSLRFCRQHLHRHSWPSILIRVQSEFDIIRGANGFPKSISNIYTINDEGEIESEDQRQKRLRLNIISSHSSSSSLITVTEQLNRFELNVILYNDNYSYDPTPIVPNKLRETPDIWLPRKCANV